MIVSRLTRVLLLSILTVAAGCGPRVDKTGTLTLSSESIVLREIFFSPVTERRSVGWGSIVLPEPQKVFDADRDFSISFWVLLNIPGPDFTLRAVLISPDGTEVASFSRDFLGPRSSRGICCHWWNQPIPVQYLGASLGEWTLVLLFDGERMGAASFVFDRGTAQRAPGIAGDVSRMISGGRSAYRRGDYTRSMEFAEQALAATKSPQRLPRHRSEALQLLAMTHWQLGNFSEAIRALTEAQQLAEQEADDRGMAESLLGLALVHQTAGDLQRAADLVDRSLEHYRRSDHPDYGTALWRAGKLRLDLNRLEEAEALFDAAQRNARASQRPDLLSRAALGLAEVHRRRGDPIGLLSAAASAPSGSTSSETQLLMGWWHLDAGRHKEARTAFQNAYEIAEARRGLTLWFEPMLGLARVEIASGNFRRARKYVSQLESRTQRLTLTSQTWRLWLAKALMYELDGRHATAYRALREAARQVELIRARIEVDQLRATYAEDKQELYEAMIRIGLRLRRHPEAFDTIERAKSRAFLDLLAYRRTAEPSDYAQLERTQREIEATMAAIEKGSGDRLEDLAIKSEELRAVAEQRLATAQGRDVVSRRLVEASAQPASVKDVGRRLPGRAAILNYYFGRRLAVVGILRAEGAEIIQIKPIATTELLAFARALSDRGSFAWEVQARELYERLLKPVEHRLQGIDTLIVSAHGALHYVPFQALLTGAGEFVGSRFVVTYLPSASTLPLIPDVPVRGPVFAVANPSVPGLAPLPGAEAEVRGVAQLLPTRTLLGQQAQKRVVVAESPGFRILHFATHGELDKRLPMNSSLRLAPADDDDGRLTVDEIFNLRLAAGLVVLSACDTGVGLSLAGEPISTGDEVVSLGRAFLHAGARNLVVSLWRVADASTAELMIDFYRNLQAQLPPAKALQLAQMRFINRGAGSGPVHPFYWAGFVLVGDGR